MSDKTTDLSESPDADDEYVVEKVVDKKIENGKIYYRIKWLGWPDADNTWEPIENCAKCENLISQFEEAAAQRKKAYTLDNHSSSDSSDSISSDDSNFSAKKRVHFKKKGKKPNNSWRSSKGKSDLGNDSDTGDGNKKSRKKVSSSKVKNKNNHEDGNVNIGFGDAMASLDQSSSEKFKRPKDSAKEHRKISEYKDKEQIQMYLNTGCGAKGKDRTTNEDSKKIASAKSRVESEPSSQGNSKDKHKKHRSNCSKASKEKVSSRNEKPTKLKRSRRISTSSSDDDSYSNRYFGYERNKKLVEIVEWCKYDTKILHLVRYSDGEEEYLSDSVTLERWPEKVSEMYQRHLLNESMPEELKNTLNSELKNASFVKKVAAAIKSSATAEKNNEMSSLQMESLYTNVESICSSINPNNTDKINDESLQSKVSKDQIINDTTYTKEVFDDLGSSVIAIDSTAGASLSLQDSEFVVHSDTSLSQNLSQSQVAPEFEVEPSGNEDSLESIGSANGLLDNQLQFEDGNETTQNNNSYRAEEYEDETEASFNPSTYGEDDEDFVIYFNPSPPRALLRQNDHY